MQQELGFAIPLSPEATLTGHIDLLQMRNGRIPILDYKPNAVRDKSITQRMVYALALSRRTGLRLYDFVCAGLMHITTLSSISSMWCTRARTALYGCLY